MITTKENNMPQLNKEEVEKHTDIDTSCALCNKEYNMQDSHPVAPDVCGECWGEIDPYWRDNKEEICYKIM